MRLTALQRTLRPSAWPIAGKLAFAFVIAALIPIFLTAIYGSRETLAAVNESEKRSIAQLAQTTAGRIDQLIRTTSKSIRLLQRLDTIRAAALQPTPENRARAAEIASDLIAVNPDLELVLLMTPQGRVLAASSPQYVGKEFGWRRYVKQAAQGEDYVSSLEVGSESGQRGVYFSGPIRAADGGVIGVVVAKLGEAAIQQIIEQSQTRTSQDAFLIDEFGVVIAHRDSKKIFKSLAPLPPEVVNQLRADRRYETRESTPATDTVSGIGDLGRSALAAALVGVRRPGTIVDDDQGQEHFVAYMPLVANGWVFAVSEATDSWATPLRAAFTNALSKAIIVALVAALVALAIVLRDIIHPVQALTASARAIRRGELKTAEAAVINDDEIGYLAKSFNRMIEGIAARERERDIFGRVVSPEVRERLLAGQLKLGGENRRVSVLFSDIRDFTTLCEDQPPEAVVELINEYLTEMTAAISPHKGYVNNFLGDAIIVVFGAPQDHAAPASAALRAAFDMQTRLAELNKRRVAAGKFSLRSGIGIATGVVIAGQMGSLDRFVYTVIGDAVNVASRLEALTKEFGGNPILVNGPTAELARGDRDIALEYVGSRLLKGRSEAVDVFSATRAAGS